MQEQISKAEAAVEEAKSRFGEDHLELSYKLDELAVALKADGRLLEAANASAKAKAIRSKHFASESQEQAEKFGDASASEQTISASTWLKHLYRAALCGSALLLLFMIFIKETKPELKLARELIGSSAAAVTLQLLLFPLKSIPRPLKFIIVAIGTSLIWMLVGGS